MKPARVAITPRIGRLLQKRSRVRALKLPPVGDAEARSRIKLGWGFIKLLRGNLGQSPGAVEALRLSADEMRNSLYPGG